MYRCITSAYAYKLISKFTPKKSMYNYIIMRIQYPMFEIFEDITVFKLIIIKVNGPCISLPTF